MLKVKIVGSLEKIFLNDSFESKQQIKTITAARGERVSFQVMLRRPKEGARIPFKMSVRSGLLHCINSFRVGNVPCETPIYRERSDDDYITKEPGLFPDVLFPIKRTAPVMVSGYCNETLFFTAEIPVDTKPGDYPVSFTFTEPGSGSKNRARVVISVKNAVIEKSDLIYTQWMFCDSIADYFHVPMQSERHWKLIERYLKAAAHTGVNMILTPIFTPPVDTEINGERPTMQLVKITRSGKKYEFDFADLDRWVELCHSCGIKYFEMAHLFTQWGAAACPKIIVNENGKEIKDFGWQTPAMGEKYKNFLSQFLPALTEHLKKLGIADKSYFHISDEPSIDPEKPDYKNYLAAKEFISPYIEGFRLMDALSHIEYYDNGLVNTPVPTTDHIEPFLERDIKERWCYYCCAQGNLVANRMFAAPAYRNRISGVQFYLGNIDGFLHWGMNYYYDSITTILLDPYLCTDAAQRWPGGDSYSLYPYKNNAIECTRTVVFYEGLQDMMLLKQVEKKLGREKTVRLVHDTAGMTVTFSDYPRNKEFLPALHDKLIEILSK